MVQRVTPATGPLETAAGEAFEGVPWLRTPGPATRAGPGWCAWPPQHAAVRLVAAERPPAAAAIARRRVRHTVQQPGRPPSATACLLAAWGRRVTPLAATAWPLGDVLRRYRARWPVARVVQRMPQVRQRKHSRRRHPTRVEATGRAWRRAWAVPEAAMAMIRAHLPTDTPRAPLPVSRGLRTGCGRETVRPHVSGPWSQARVQTCVPRLRRFVGLSPRRREPQDTTIRAWLTGRALVWPAIAQEAA